MSELEKGIIIGAFSLCMFIAIVYFVTILYSNVKDKIRDMRTEKIKLLDRIKKLEFYKDSNESTILALEYELKDIKKKIGAKK